MFITMLKLIKTILLFPFFLYISLMERLIKFFLRLAFQIIKVEEQLPIVGPWVTSLLHWMSEWRLFQWLEKVKEE